MTQDRPSALDRISAAASSGPSTSLYRISFIRADPRVAGVAQELTDALEISPNHREKAASKLAVSISCLMSAAEYYGHGSPAKSLSTRKRIALLCRQLLKAINELEGPGIRTLNGKPTFDLENYELIEDSSGEEFYPRMIKELLERVESRLPKRPLAAHRPKGRPKYPYLEWTLQILSDVAARFHGRLTLTMDARTGKATGTLIRALKVLNRIMPDHVPAKISYQTLRRVRRMAQLRKNKPNTPVPR